MSESGGWGCGGNSGGGGCGGNSDIGGDGESDGGGYNINRTINANAIYILYRES